MSKGGFFLEAWRCLASTTHTTRFTVYRSGDCNTSLLPLFENAPWASKMGCRKPLSTSVSPCASVNNIWNQGLPNRGFQHHAHPHFHNKHVRRMPNILFSNRQGGTNHKCYAINSHVILHWAKKLTGRTAELRCKPVRTDAPKH